MKTPLCASCHNAVTTTESVSGRSCQVTRCSDGELLAIDGYWVARHEDCDSYTSAVEVRKARDSAAVANFWEGEERADAEYAAAFVSGLIAEKTEAKRIRLAKSGPVVKSDPFVDDSPAIPDEVFANLFA